MKNLTKYLLASIVTSMVLQQASAQDFLVMAPSRNEALRQMANGSVLPATERLLNEVRQVSVRDDRMADLTFGHVQMIMFSIEYLMSEEQQTDFVKRNCAKNTDELGALIRVLYDAFLPKNEDDLEVFYTKLWEMSGSNDPLVAVAALFLLSDPYYTAELPIGISARERLATDYPDLEVTREAIRLPLYWYRTALPPMYGRVRTIYEDHPELMMRVSDAEKAMMTKDPFYTTLARVMGQMNGKEMALPNAQPLFDALDKEEDWRNRYSLLRLIEPLIKDSPTGVNLDKHWAPLRDPLRRLSEKETVTPDVFRSWVLLAKLGRINRNADEVEKWTTRVLQRQERAVEHPERILFEEAVKSAESGAKALERYSMPAEAARIYDKLADSYPGTPIEAEFRPAATAARERAQIDAGTQLNGLTSEK